MTRRRAFVLVLAAPLVARAQPSRKVWRIAYLGNNPPASSALTSALLAAFHAGMREAGLDENVDYVLEARYGDGRAERYPELAAQAARAAPTCWSPPARRPRWPCRRRRRRRRS